MKKQKIIKIMNIIEKSYLSIFFSIMILIIIFSILSPIWVTSLIFSLVVFDDIMIIVASVMFIIFSLIVSCISCGLLKLMMQILTEKEEERNEIKQIIKKLHE